MLVALIECYYYASVRSMTNTASSRSVAAGRGWPTDESLPLLSSSSSQQQPHLGAHRQYWRNIILGVNDGLLISTFLLITGVAGGGLSSQQILLTALAGEF